MGLEFSTVALPPGSMIRPLREAREREKITQLELARAVGVAPSQVSRWETGSRRIRLDEAKKIAEKLKIDISEIMGSEPPSPRQRLAEHGSTLVTLPLPEGRVILEYPPRLSPQSREAFKEWLALIAKVATQE